MVLFAATTIRLMIENFLKYGIRINPKNWVMAVLTPEGMPHRMYSRRYSCLYSAVITACCDSLLRSRTLSLLCVTFLT